MREFFPDGQDENIVLKIHDLLQDKDWWSPVPGATERSELMVASHGGTVYIAQYRDPQSLKVIKTEVMAGSDGYARWDTLEQLQEMIPERKARIENVLDTLLKRAVTEDV